MGYFLLGLGLLFGGAVFFDGFEGDEEGIEMFFAFATELLNHSVENPGSRIWLTSRNAEFF